MTGRMPVDGSAAKSAAMIAAVPRRNAYGEATIRPTRTGTSRSSRPVCASSTCSTGSRRPGGGVQSPSVERGTRLRIP